MERQYAPYIKWFATAFGQLECADRLGPIFMQAVSATSWQEREKVLASAYEAMAEMHNGLGITEPLPTQVSRFFDRPFLVIHADYFDEAIRAVITDPEVRALPENLGSIDQFVDSTDVLDCPERFDRLKLMYQCEESQDAD
jgi:hypothetical protein